MLYLSSQERKKKSQGHVEERTEKIMCVDIVDMRLPRGGVEGGVSSKWPKDLSFNVYVGIGTEAGVRWRRKSQKPHMEFTCQIATTSAKEQTRNIHPPAQAIVGKKAHLFSAQALDKKIKRNQNFKSLPHVSEILIYTSRVQKAPDWKLI